MPQRLFVIVILGLACSTGLWACSQEETPKNRAAAGTGERLPHQVPKALRACRTDSDCVAVVAGCCPCREGDYVGVHKDHSAEARTLKAPVNCGPCPPIECPTLKTLCNADNLCNVIEVE